MARRASHRVAKRGVIALLYVRVKHRAHWRYTSSIHPSRGEKKKKKKFWRAFVSSCIGLFFHYSRVFFIIFLLFFAVNYNHDTPG